MALALVGMRPKTYLNLPATERQVLKRCAMAYETWRIEAMWGDG